MTPFIELPGPTRVVLLGSAHAEIQRDGRSYLTIRVDILGDIDLRAKTVAFDAVLVDSHLLGTLDLTGGVTINNGQLNDDSGSVIATTTTDSKGQYHFDQQSGLSGTGTYTVSLVVPAGDTQISVWTSRPARRWRNSARACVKMAS